MTSGLLAANSLAHGILLLFELRAFQWTGQRLLPIMRSVQPIAGMLVIMLFLLLAFVHAFWAIDRDHADEVRLFEVVIFLFTGEGFIGSDDLDLMDFSRRS